MDERSLKIDYHQLREFISREFGLFFETGKFSFLENRILPLFSKINSFDLNDFIKTVQADQSFKNELLAVLTTNETWFFRHPKHFEILREVIFPSIRDFDKRPSKEIYIWSAGCSIGAEAYSIAIVAREMMTSHPNVNVKIIGSDISPYAISKAKEGIYSSTEIRLVPQRLLAAFFIPSSPGFFKVKPELSQMVSFELRNLLDSKWIDISFDIIFCRNTMIYFNEETKKHLTERFFNGLKNGGIFIPGSTETLHWGENRQFIREFAMGEYFYRKCVQSFENFQYFFSTPHDLLKAISLLVEENIEFTITPIDIANPASKRSLYVPKGMEEKAEQIFSKANIEPVLRKKSQLR
ncbi:MAG: protein-glutamate O-methyltransferase CheR [Candidatus Riflebacteria bacterium]|nr:protein-glutamate O-methyltransferase CheR [Candidatus Riflebacteria bacterium]